MDNITVTAEHNVTSDPQFLLCTPLYLAGWILGGFTFLIAFILYVIDPQKLNCIRSIHLNHMVCVFLVCLILGVRCILKFNVNMTLCIIMGISFRWFDLSSMCCLSSLSYRTWRGLSYRSFSQGERTSYRFRRSFIICSVVPAFFVIPAVVLSVYEVDLIKNNHPMTMESCFCYFSSSTYLAMWYYAPTLLILVFNLIFGGFAVYRLRQAAQLARPVNNDIDKQMVGVYMRLIVLDGIGWVFNAIVWIVGANELLGPEQQAVILLQKFLISLVYIRNTKACSDLINFITKSFKKYHPPPPISEISLSGRHVGSSKSRDGSRNASQSSRHVGSSKVRIGSKTSDPVNR